MKKMTIDCSQPQPTVEVIDMTPEEIAQVEASRMPTIQQQISMLEAQQTPRRIREAITGEDDGWMENLDQEIAALRDQL